MDEIPVYKQTTRPATKSEENLGDLTYLPKKDIKKPTKIISISQKQKLDHPIDNVNWLSFATFSWISNFMFASHKHGFDPTRIPFISPLESSLPNTEDLEALWKHEVQNNAKPKFSRILWKSVRRRVSWTSGIYMISLILGFLTPTLFMRKILEFASNPEANKLYGAIWVALLILCEFGRVILFTLTWAMNYRTALRLRTACMGLTYKKLLNLGHISESTTSTILNLITGDCGKIHDVVTVTQMALGGPVILLLSIVYIMIELGYLSIIGLLIFPLFYPIQYGLAKASATRKKNAIDAQDKRITLMSQVLRYLKFLKMFAWEKYFGSLITNVRSTEINAIRNAQLFHSFSVVIAPTLPHICAIITFILYIETGNSLTPAQAFSIVALFISRIRPSINTVRSGLRAYFDAEIAISRFQCFTVLFLFTLFGYTIRSVNQIFESIQICRMVNERMERILTIPEGNRAQVLSKPDSSEVIAFENVSVVRRSLPHSKSGLKNAKKNKKFKKLEKKKQKPSKVSLEKLLSSPINKSDVVCFQLENINLSIRKGSFVGICGSIGSGKSTFLQSIVGLLSIDQGQIVVNGRIAYSAQEPWIFNGTLRENIVFGDEFEAVRYYKTINACCLVNDFGNMAAGDLTITSDNGSNLSGGQKSRIGLARTMYHSNNSDVFLFDDPFASLDSKVSKTIYKKIIQDQLTSDESKTVILVTHQMKFLKDCDEILVFSDGSIVEQGKHSELMENENSFYRNLVNSSSKSRAKETDEITVEDSGLLDADSIDPDEVTFEIKCSDVKITGEGDIPWSVYSLYMNCAGGLVPSVIVLFGFALSIGSTAFSSWWLKQWFRASSSSIITEYNTTDKHISISTEAISRDSPNFAFNRDVYACIIAVIFLTSLFRTILFVFTTIRASKGLHSRLLTYFFRNRLKNSERIGTGQILNLFSKDIEQIDMALPNSLEFLLQNLFIVISVFVLVLLVFPIFILPLLFLLIIFVYIRRIYNGSIRDLKRLEIEKRTPIFTKVKETDSGLSTIRAFHKEKQMINQFNEISDSYHTVFYTFNSAMRWLSFRLDSLAISVTGITAILILFFHGKVSASASGLALSYAAQLSGIFQYTVRLATETQTRFVSVERISQFFKKCELEEPDIFNSSKQSNMKKELVVTSLNDFHPNWPINGHVRFDSIYLNYSVDHESVLKDLSFEAMAGETIGIIGRTGSGKSSIGSALFRLLELKKGTITIDSVDISSLPLSKLRNSLCVIPQEPAIFQGTIRFNLDPNGTSLDGELWEVLGKTGLKSTIDNLDKEIPLSQGQQQLLSIARALLRRSLIVFVDEATSNTDSETSSIIDRLIVEEFKSSTVFIVAHRLNYKLCDKLLILDDGQLKDFGPAEIIAKKPEFYSFFEKYDEN